MTSSTPVAQQQGFAAAPIGLSSSLLDATPIADQPFGIGARPQIGATPSMLDPTPIAQQPGFAPAPIGLTPSLLDPTAIAPQPLGATPSFLDPTPLDRQPGFAPAPIGLTPSLLDPTRIADQALPRAPFTPAVDTLTEPTPVGTRAFANALPAAAQPPQIGYGDQPLGVPVHEMSSVTPEGVRAVVGEHLAAYRAAQGLDQDLALEKALDAAYAYRVQGGDLSAFDRIAAEVADDPRAEVMTKVARDRAEAIVAAGIEGNIRALNNSGINFGAQLAQLQKNLQNNPDDAYTMIGQALSVLKNGPGAASAVNDIQIGALRQAVTSLGFGRELQDVVMAEARRTEQAPFDRRQAQAQMTMGERMSYMAGQLLDSGALFGGGAALGMAVAAGPRYTPGVATGVGTPLTGGQWIAGGVQGPTPTSVADALRGRTFRDFDHYREAYWGTVAATPALANQFSRPNQILMEKGRAPFAPRTQQQGGQAVYNLHHEKFVSRGGAVYDADNITVVSPKRHHDIHYGK